MSLHIFAPGIEKTIFMIVENGKQKALRKDFKSLSSAISYGIKNKLSFRVWKCSLSKNEYLGWSHTIVAKIGGYIK